jgi:hypothetical protein
MKKHMEEMIMIKILDEGILYRNPLPQLRVVHACFPVIQELSEQELLCVYRRGTAFESADGVIGKLRSTDGGKSWVEEGVVWDLSKDNKPYSYRSGNLTKLRDGTLLLLSSRWDRSDPDKPLYNPKTEGYLPAEVVLFRSLDNGRSWLAPQVVPLPEGIIGNHSGPILELSNGHLLLPFETWKDYDDLNPAEQRAMALFSNDDGKTWGNPTAVADGTIQGIFYWDQHIIALDNGHLFTMFWVHDAKADKDLQIHYAISKDEGCIWTRPKPTGINGQVSCPVEVGHGRLLLIYNLRYAERPGIMAVLSENGGKTWDFAHQVMLWDAQSQTNVGTASQARAIADMATFGFGKPDAHKLTNGDILISFWCTQACVTHIRWCRLRVK